MVILYRCFQIIYILSDNIHPIQEVEYGGYRPIRKQMAYVPEVKEPAQIGEWDPVKKECMVRLVNLCEEKGIKLIFIYSPSYGGVRPSSLSLFKQFVEENSLVFLDHYTDPDFCMHKDFFYDSIHMNDTGASEYTRKLVGELKKII